MSLQYCMIARTEILDFIKRSTRFSIDQVAFTDEHVFDAAFSVEVRHHIAPTLSESTQSGAVAADNSDWVAESFGDYSQLVTNLLREAGQRVDVVGYLAKRLERERYGKHIAPYFCRQHERRVLYTYTCPTCSGRGEVTCSSCHGQGSHTCGACDGAGGHTVSDEWDISERHTVMASHFETCISCGGSGEHRCTRCNGRGIETCSRCEGQGQLTDIGTAVLMASPTYRLDNIRQHDPAIVHALMHYASLPAIADGWATPVSRSIDAEEVRYSVVERMQFTCPFYQATVNTVAATAPMVVFGEKHSISDASHLIEPLLQPDLEMLTFAVSKLRRCDWPMTRWTQCMLTLFLQSDLHQSLIREVSQSKDPIDYAALSIQLSRALSPEYLQRAVDKMDAIAQWTSASHAKAWTVVTAMLCILLGKYFYYAGDYVLGFASIGSTYLVARELRWRWTCFRLRQIGRPAFLQFALRRGVNRGLLGGY